MPTVEDYFDDDTDIPLPSTSSRHLPNTGGQGALLEEISSDDPDVPELDYDKIAEQSRGIYGEGQKAPPPSSYKGKVAVRDEPGEIRPTSGGAGPAANTPMGGFMGDMMRLQQAEEERMEKMRQQFGGAQITQSMDYKGWNTVYPIYFDAKLSISDGRRVKREDAMWWPQARQIGRACQALGLQSVLEPDKTHPADWENPGRVKVQFERDGRFINPIVKNRTQLYRQLAKMIQQQEPSLAYKPTPKIARKSYTFPLKVKANAKAVPANAKSQPTPNAKSGKASSSATRPTVRRHPYGSPRPPRPTHIPPLDDRLPLHSPVVQTGVAVASVKRELETEKENKRKGIGAGVGAGGEEKAEGGKEKAPKIKRMVVRGKR